MARKTGDTVQVTLRVPRHLLEEAETIAKLISTTGFEASPTDALRAGIVRGFEQIAKEKGSFHVSAWDGINTTCLYTICKDAREAVAAAKELARQHVGGKWTVFRVYAKGDDKPIEQIPVREPK